jgi:ShK domain-like
METNCRKSCGLCTPKDEEPPVCRDVLDSCREWASKGMCSGFWRGKKGQYTIDAPFVVEMCPRSCGVCNIHLDERDWNLGMGFPQSAPELGDFIDESHMKQRLKAAVAETAVYIRSLPEEIRSVCKFGHVNCLRLAMNPESCPKNKGHYIYDYLCAAACRTCEKFVDIEERDTAKEYFDDALDEVQKYIDYKKSKAERDAQEATLY